jgi:tetratricopeptide (TPR) repeat protein
VNIGITYLNLNNKDEAKRYFEKAKSIDKNINVPTIN